MVSSVMVVVLAAVKFVAVPEKTAVSKGVRLVPGAVAGVVQLIFVPKVLVPPIHCGAITAPLERGTRVIKNKKNNLNIILDKKIGFNLIASMQSNKNIVFLKHNVVNELIFLMDIRYESILRHALRWLYPARLHLSLQ